MTIAHALQVIGIAGMAVAVGLVFPPAGIFVASLGAVALGTLLALPVRSRRQ